MFARGDALGVAVSGGADSVVLLHVLHRLAGTLAIRLTVLHVNHGLRGQESDGDQQFVDELAASLGLVFFAARAQPLLEGNLEQESRRIRREFFQSCRQQHGLQKIALGHTRTDQAETVLFRLLRGSGVAGLAAMRPATKEGFIRPLLEISRSEVRAWAASQGITWREDSSNYNEEFARNSLRNRVMPALAAEFNPNLEGILSGTADVAGAEEDYWQEQIEPLYQATVTRSEPGLIFPVKVLLGNHLAVQRRLIRRAIQEVRGDLRSIDQQHVQAVLNICQSEHGHDRILIPGVDALRSFASLLLGRPGELNSGPRNYSIDLSCEAPVQLPYGAGYIELAVLNGNQPNCVNFKKESQFSKEIADLDLEVLSVSGSRLQVRNWRPGDEILRPGHRSPEKIKSLFQESRVLLWKRRHWPVAVVKDEIFWARKFGAASQYSPKPGTKAIARLSYWSSDQGGEL